MKNNFENTLKMHKMTGDFCRCAFCKERNVDFLFPSHNGQKGAHVKCVELTSKEIKTVGKPSKRAKKPVTVFIQIRVYENPIFFAYLIENSFCHTFQNVFSIKCDSLQSVSKTLNELRFKFTDSIVGFDIQYLQNSHCIETYHFNADILENDFVGEIRRTKARLEGITTSETTQSIYYNN